MSNTLEINYPIWNVSTKSYEYAAINLLPWADVEGMAVISWDATVQAYKEGGIFLSSPLSPGRELIFGQLANAIENIPLSITGADQQDVFIELDKFFDAWRNVGIFWTDRIRGVPPTYIKVQAQDEIYPRYAVIVNTFLTNFGQVLQQPFFDITDVSLDNIALVIERTSWASTVPNTSDCADQSNEFNWYREALAVEATTGSATGGTHNTVYREVIGGNLIAANDTDITVSADNGENWTENYSEVAGNHHRVAEIPGVGIYVNDLGRGEIVESTDQGANWSAFSISSEIGYAPLSVHYGQYSGRFYAGLELNTLLFYSVGAPAEDAMSSITLPNILSVFDILEPATNTLLLATSGGVLASFNNGATWSYVFVSPHTNQDIPRLRKLNDGRIIVCTYGGVGVSEDNGATWVYKAAATGFTSADLVSDVVEYGDFVYACLDDIEVYVSYKDDLLSWVSISIGWSGSGTAVLCGTYTDNGWLVFGSSADANSQWFLYKVDEYITLGENQCGPVFVGNHQALANLTHIKLFDATLASYTDLFPASSFPLALFPTAFDTHILYFIIDSTLDNSGRFCCIAFNLTAPMLDVTGSVWEYYNGSIWVTLTVSDTTRGGLSPLQRTGQQAVTFIPPSNWATTTIDGITGWMIRLRLTANGGTIFNEPKQATWDIFAVNRAYFDITNILGDINAATYVKITNKSDVDGRDGTAPDLFTNRIVMGSKRLSEGENFNAYLNASDEQIPLNITVTLGNNCTFISYPSAPTGRAVLYNPTTSSEAMLDRAVWDIFGLLGKQYSGVYHAYARVYQSTGSPGDFVTQLQLTFGTGGLYYTSDRVLTLSTDEFEVLDFGSVVIPKFKYITDTMQIGFQSSSSNASANLNIIDVILIPVGAWAGDYSDVADTNASLIIRNESLVIDGLLPLDTPALVLTEAGAVKAQYEISGQPMNLEPTDDDTHRIWCLAMHTNADDGVWLSPPQICHLVEVQKSEQFMGFRSGS